MFDLGGIVMLVGPSRDGHLIEDGVAMTRGAALNRARSEQQVVESVASRRVEHRRSFSNISTEAVSSTLSIVRSVRCHEPGLNTSPVPTVRTVLAIMELREERIG